MKLIEKKAFDEQKRLEEWYESMVKRLPLSKDTIVKKDISYMDEGHERYTFDVYYKATGEGIENVAKLPVIFDFPGGGFISGDKKYNTWFADDMSGHGFLVFVFNYPLAFERKLYDILHDCYEGMKVAYDMIEELGGDKDNIYLCGDSAGGFLATYLAAINNDNDMAECIGVKSIHMNIKAVCGISALFYCSKVDKNAIFVMRKTLFGDDYKNHPFFRYVNPEKEVYKALPPVYGITSKGDFLESYTIDFIRFMNIEGKKAMYYSYDDKHLKHDFVCMNPECPHTGDAIDRIVEFLQSH